MVDRAVLSFVASPAVLLAIPGPTNALLAASGAFVGVRKSRRLVIAAIAGYLLAIFVLMQARRWSSACWRA